LPYLQVLLFMAAPFIDFFLVLWSPTQTGRISAAIGLTIIPVIAFMMWGRRLGVLATVITLVTAAIMGAMGLIPGQVTLILFTAIANSGLMLGWTAHTTRRLEFDPVTGLANRHALDRLLARTLRDPDTTAASCFLAVLDVDGVHHHNEVLGRRAVDDLLHQVGSTLTERLQDRAQVFHLGAGEFAALLVGDRREIVEQLATLRQAPAAGVTLCAGISTLAVPTTAARLLNQAEASLTRAKATGPDTMDPLLTDDVLVHDLRDALPNGQLTVLYQPIVDLATDTTVGCEALVRWDHPTRGRIGPDRFIPLAEEAGLIHDLGRFVLRQACTEAAAATAEGRQLRHLSVNASGLELLRPEYADDVLQALAETGLDPRRLVLEVTESSVAGQDPLVATTLTRLRQRGIRVAIDDFGTGYSSLSQLGHLPVDILKIDKSFIWADATPLRDSVLTAIMGLATAFGLTAVAEGIETWDHLDLLRRLGCTLGQGYLYGRPSTFTDLDLPATATRTQEDTQKRAQQPAADQDATAL
jgi:diguanylate cyclase (GGDEF)-like protein